MVISIPRIIESLLIALLLLLLTSPQFMNYQQSLFSQMSLLPPASPMH